MANMTVRLESALQAAIIEAFGNDLRDFHPHIRANKEMPEFDYQTDCAFLLAKRLKLAPTAIATRIVEALDNTIFVKATASGPGFINLQLNDAFLTEQVNALRDDARLGADTTTAPEVVAIDYGGFNVAKELHVGHIRSTIIGDALVRILTFLGHTVIRQNHLGDWGTQFGFLIEFLIDTQQTGNAMPDLAAVSKIYQQAKKRFDEDPDFQARSKKRVVLLQSGDAATLAIWKQLIENTKAHFHKILPQLGVLLVDEDIRGESFYNDMLAGIVEQLEQKGVCETSDGAQVIFLEGFKDREQNPIPMIIRKSDGGYLYATTDLAAAKFRIEELHATRLIYVVDARQKQHLQMLFAALRKIGWANEHITMEHVAFGSILGADRKPFKTRSGELVALASLLDEAEVKAAAILANRGEMSPQELSTIANAIGIGALKYADLHSDLTKDYVFDWDKMLSFHGDTAAYLQSAYVRICSIFRKSGMSMQEGRAGQIRLSTSEEKAVALKLMEFGDIVAQIEHALTPHLLCRYLHDLATHYHAFYEKCPVLREGDVPTRASRLALSALTAKMLSLGLGLLGIKTIEYM